MNSYIYIHQYIYSYAPIENAYTPQHNHTSKLSREEKMKVQKYTPNRSYIDLRGKRWLSTRTLYNSVKGKPVEHHEWAKKSM